jgi:hypothetical protein
MRRPTFAAIGCFCIAGALCLAASSIADEQKPAKADNPPKAKRPANTGQSDKRTNPKASRKKSDNSKPNQKTSEENTKRPPNNLAVIGMTKTVVEADIKDMSLEDFAEWIGRDTGANVIVRWKLLEKEGVTSDSKINVKVKDISIRQLLAHVFLNITQDKPKVELSAHAEGNILTISTRQDLNTKMITRVYDVQDLIQSRPDFFGQLDEEKRDEEEFPHASGKRTQSRLKHTQRGQTLSPHILDLIDGITTNIDSESWKVNGGRGRIKFFNGKLVIYNSVEVHQKIGGPVDSRN